MIEEDRGDVPVTSAKIEAVASPLECIVRYLIGPSSAHWRSAPLGRSGCCKWPRRISGDGRLAPEQAERIVTQGGEMRRKHAI